MNKTVWRYMVDMAEKEPDSIVFILTRSISLTVSQK